MLPTILKTLALAAILAATAPAQIKYLCNTGQTTKTASGCTGVLVTPNPFGGGPNLDGNWWLAAPYPSPASGTPCHLPTWGLAWVDTPPGSWLPNSASSASEWITPMDGEQNLPAGYYAYATRFPIPAVLPGGGAPTGLTITGRLASDNPTYGIFLESPGPSTNCAMVLGQAFPVNPAGQGSSDFTEWWPFSFTNATAITPGADAYLYFVVQNAVNIGGSGGPSPTGLRVEFTSSAFTN